MSYSTKELIEQVRSQIQEKNQSALRDDDIISALNRGQDYAINILARRYPEPLLAVYTPTFDENDQTPIPEDAFEQRVLAVEVQRSGNWQELQAISYDRTHQHESRSGGTTAHAYAIIGSKIQVYSKAGGNSFRIWYVKTVPPLVKSEGRIVGIDDPLPYVDNYTAIGTSGDVIISGVPTHTVNETVCYRIDVTAVGSEFKWSNDDGATYTTGVTWVDDTEIVLESGVTVKFLSTETYQDGNAWTFKVKFTDSGISLDEIGTNLSTSGAYSKYVNIIDAQTGEIKDTLEISAINTGAKTLTFKEIPSRAIVLNRTISSSLGDSVELDDFICPISGSCILFFKQPMFNFVMQFAVAEARRALGYDVTVEENKLAKMEKQLSKIRSNRSQTWRVKMNNPRWR